MLDLILLLAAIAVGVICGGIAIAKAVRARKARKNALDENITNRVEETA